MEIARRSPLIERQRGEREVLPNRIHGTSFKGLGFIVGDDGKQVRSIAATSRSQAWGVGGGSVGLG